MENAAALHLSLGSAGPFGGATDATELLALGATLGLTFGALCATLAGALSVSKSWGALRTGILVFLGPLLGMALGTVVASRSSAPDPLLAGAALGSLCLLGAVCVPYGRGALPVGLARAAALVLVGVFLDGAASGWSVFEGGVAGGAAPPWSPEVSARLLDVSPRAYVMELGGLDWMRDPSVYDSVGTDRISPTLRSARGGMLALLMPLVVGLCGLIVRLLAGSTPQNPEPASRSTSVL